MIYRKRLRDYLFAMLASESICQDNDCNLGPLWTCCDGSAADVRDSDVDQQFDDADGEYEINHDDAEIVFGIESQSFTLANASTTDDQLTFYIHITVRATTGRKRQDILDVIQERLLHRLFAPLKLVNFEITDESDPARMMRSPLYSRNGTPARVTVSEDDGIEGSFTIRTLRFEVAYKECVTKTDCYDMPLCINLQTLEPCENG